ncbi:MAG: 50S ribosomal protein L23 [Gemmatimonadetes bacterium]|jgi:large subunit ribosomal protein L23|nr:50S ribosomal protein L23 [Gemmatimonadota bacterium]
MRNIHEVIVRPVVTEKSTDLLDRFGAYTFVVNRDSNKLEIAKAVETLFNVKVRNVRTMQYRGKERRVGKHTGRRAAWKKAVVTLREGDSIEIFEGV